MPKRLRVEGTNLTEDNQEAVEMRSAKCRVQSSPKPRKKPESEGGEERRTLTEGNEDNNGRG